MPNNSGATRINLDADGTPYTDAIPQGGIAVGTVTQNKVTGALVLIEAQQDYLLIAPNLVHKLNTRKVRAAIHQAQPLSAEPES